MQELMIRPTIYSFDNCRQFAEEFKLGKGDLLFTNKRLFKKFFEPLGLGIVGIWFGVLADQMSRFIFATIRFKQGKWVKIKI